MNTANKTSPTMFSVNPWNDIVILANKKTDGTVFELHPHTKLKIQKDFPNAALFSQLFVGDDANKSLNDVRASAWEQILILLTGLSKEKIESNYHSPKIIVEYPKTKQILDLT